MMNHANAPTRFAPGSTLDAGKYRIIRQLGAGGMGTVFEAENTLTRKRVAIKCLLAARLDSAEASARLLREAEAASRIRHPNAVDLYDVGRDGDSIFLVMEYLEGEPLSALLERSGTPMHVLVALLLLAMRAVAEAHRCGVVHRDIKPDNIFLAREPDSDRPVPKVLDFGISKLSELDTEQTPLTLSGSTLGTPRYMAYEQLMSDKSIDGRVDVYAFGVILYEALTGQPPFDAATYPELIVKIASGTLTAPKQLRPELPETLDRLVRWALERDRTKRIPSMEQFIRELEPFSTERGLLAEMNTADRAGSPLLVAALSSTIRDRTQLSPDASEQKTASKLWPSVLLCAAACVFGFAWWAWAGTHSRIEQTETVQAAVSTRLLPDDRLDASAATAAEAPPLSGRETPNNQAATSNRPPEAANTTAATPIEQTAPKLGDKPAQSSGKRRITNAQQPAAAASRQASKESTATTVPVASKNEALAQQPSAAADQPAAATPNAPAPEPAKPASSAFRVKLPQSEDF